MEIRFSDQKEKFSNYLFALKKCEIISYSTNNTKHKISKQTIPCKFSEFPFSSFFDYNIFPKSILTAYAEWGEENRAMKSGDTIVQEIKIPPLRSFSIKVLAGVRIKEVFDEASRKGFSYETLLGHVETGVSTFVIEEHGENCIFTIETYSKPSNVFLRLFEPVTSMYQDYCTQEALLNVKKLVCN